MYHNDAWFFFVVLNYLNIQLNILYDMYDGIESREGEKRMHRGACERPYYHLRGIGTPDTKGAHRPLIGRSMGWGLFVV